VRRSARRESHGPWDLKLGFVVQYPTLALTGSQAARFLGGLCSALCINFGEASVVISDYTHPMKEDVKEKFFSLPSRDTQAL
jgi:hypothetical protein